MTPACEQAVAELRRLLLGIRFFALLGEIADALLTEGWSLVVQLLEGALISFEFSTEQRRAVESAIACFRSLVGGNMACSNTHTTSVKTQGPGVCCQAAAGQPTPIGARFAATDKNGHCFVCEVKASTSRSHPGVKVFKRGKANVPGSAVSCPSTTGGCCALAA